MRNYIILNGNNSNNITGLLIQSLAPITKPAIRTMIEEIDGRDGDIVTPLGYGAYDKEISIGLYGSYNVDDVIAFFNNNKSGKATFSNEDDKYYNYEIYEQIDFDRLIRFKTATVKMHVQPFKYPTTETEKEIEAEFIEDTGTNLSLNNTTEAPLDIELLPDTQQNGTPTPDSPIDIQVVTGNQNIKIENKNLIKSSDFQPQKALIGTGVGGNFSLNDNTNRGSIVVKVKPSTEYTFSLKTGYYLRRICEFNAVDLTNCLVDYPLYNTGFTTEKTFTTSANTNYVAVTIQSNPDGTTMTLEECVKSELQLETSATKTDYVAHQEQNYPLTLGTLEYCKIGDYSDRIFKNIVGDTDYDSSRELGKWYIKHIVKKTTNVENLISSTSIGSDGNRYFVVRKTNLGLLSENTLTNLMLCNKFKENLESPRSIGEFQLWANNNNVLFIVDTQYDTVAKIQDAYPNITTYGAGATPTYELLSDTLQDQLNALEDAMSYDTQTNISSSGDLPIIIDATAMKDGTNEGTVKNTGNIYAKPVLDIEGKGIVGVYLNGIQLFNIDLSETNEIVIDTANLEAYDPNTTQLMNRKVTGNYENFKLLVGDNTIKFTGYFTKATITNYTRWL